MPPKPKFTREKIIEAALSIVQSEGFEALTSRGIGAKLGTSSRPVFTEFQNMEEVQNETRLAANAVYNGRLAQAIVDPDPFLAVGVHYFNFAKEEPKLFEFLFMTGGKDSTARDQLARTQGNYDSILEGIQNQHELTRENAVRLFETLWLFTHGIACLQVTWTLSFTDDEVRERLVEVFDSMHAKLKSASPENKEV